MSSFRSSYTDAGVYRAKLSAGGGGPTATTTSTYGRNTSTAGSSYGNYRHSYSGIAPSSLKFSSTKNTEKERLSTSSLERPKSAAAKEERPRSTSRCSSSNGSIYEKYTGGSSKERPSSMLEKYRNSPDSSVASSITESSRGYASGEKKDKESGLAYQRLRPKSSQELGRVTPTRTPTFGKSNNSSISESSTASKFSGATSSGRYSLSARNNNPERVTTSISYVASEKFRSTSVKSPSLNEDIPKSSINKNGAVKQTNGSKQGKGVKEDNDSTDNSESISEETIIISLVTRGTSPTPPPSLTAFTRTRKLDPIPKPVKREIKKSQLLKVQRRDQGQQVEKSEHNIDKDRLSSRYSSGTNTSSNAAATTNTRASRVPWVSLYLDKLSTTPGNSSYTSRAGYSSASSNYGYSKSSEGSAKDKSSSSDHRSNSSCSNHSSASRDTSSRSNSTTAKVEPHQKRNSEDRSRRGESPRIVVGQDHGSSGSRRESLSKSSDSSSSSSSSSKPGSVSRSGSLKSRHTTSADTSLSVSVPTGGNRSVGGGGSAGGGGGGGKSSSASSAAAAAAAPVTKIKSAGAATTTAAQSASGGSNTSSSSSSSSNGGKSPSVSAGSSVSSRQASSPDARDRKPPVPKSEMVGKGATMVVPPGAIKYVNKDFRKSALNMENGDPSRSQICDRKLKKPQRSVSVSSQDSQSETTSESGQGSQRVVSSSSSANSVKSGKSAATKSSGSSSQKSASEKSGDSKKRDTLGTPSATSGNGHISRVVSRSTTDCSSSESSSSEEDDDDDDDEEEDDQDQQIKADIRPRRLSDSPFHEGKGKMSAASSRTSVLASSADELSMNADKPPRPPSSPRSANDRSPGQTDEAKSFLMRALAPVTNLFKAKQEKDSDIKNGAWADDTGSEDNAESATAATTNRSAQQNYVYKSATDHSPSKSPCSFVNSSEDKKSRLRHQSSGEKAWWLDSNSDNVPEGVDRIQTPSIGNDDISQDTTISTVLPDDGKFKFKIWRQESGERAWWLDANENNIPDDEPVCIVNKDPPSGGTSISRKSSTRSFRSVEKRNRLRHQQSGERAWWMSDDPTDVPEGVEVIPVEPKPFERLRHVDSGEKAWWLDDNSCNVPEGVLRLEPSTTSDSSESYEKVEIVGHSTTTTSCGFARFPVNDEPLGDRASPEGKENPPDPPDDCSGRSSPYDNVTLSIRISPPRRSSAPRKRPADLPLFIGTSTDVDDLLGDIIGPGHSPLPTRSQKAQYRGGDDSEDEEDEEEEEECEEIDPTQVIIHDSTPQTPVIHRRNREESSARPPQPDGYIPPLSLEHRRQQQQEQQQQQSSL